MKENDSRKKGTPVRDSQSDEEELPKERDSPRISSVTGGMVKKNGTPSSENEILTTPDTDRQNSDPELHADKTEAPLDSASQPRTTSEEGGVGAKSRQQILEKLHRRFGRRSFLSAIILLVISVGLLLISFEISNIVIEVDSLVAFISALVLLFKDSKQTVQSRVVDRMMSSSKDFVKSLPYQSKLYSVDYSYVSLDRGVRDCVVVPSSDLVDYKDQKIPLSSLIQIIPPGRSLAVLFMREMGQGETPSLDDMVRSLPTTIKERLELASFVSSKLQDNRLEVVLVHPTFRESCSTTRPDGENTSVIGCPFCSMLATVFCNNTQRILSCQGCNFDAQTDTSVARLMLGELFPEETR